MPSDRPIADPPEIPGATRRGFYMAAMYAIWGVISASLAGPALAYLFLPPKVRKDESWTDIGDVTYLTPAQPVEMAFPPESCRRLEGGQRETHRLGGQDPSGKISAFGPSALTSAAPTTGKTPNPSSSAPATTPCSRLMVP